MIFTSDSIIPQIEDLKKHYPCLEIVESDENNIRLHGSILVFRTVNDFTHHETYTLDIVIPINSTDLPYVIDSGKQIADTYHHFYPTSRKLCLETDTRIRIRFINGFNLVEWMDEFVEPYFVYYKYYQQYDSFPTGERQHGCVGILETYQDLFHTSNIKEAFWIMSYIKDSHYNGHHPCPCGCQKYIRKCHGKWILPFYNDLRMKELLLSDLTIIYEELENNATD